MKERIKKLAEQAGFSIGLNNYYWGGADGKSLEKFAELIVKECAEVANEHDCNQSGNAGEILNYFGVEE